MSNYPNLFAMVCHIFILKFFFLIFFKFSILNFSRLRAPLWLIIQHILMLSLTLCIKTVSNAMHSIDVEKCYTYFWGSINLKCDTCFCFSLLRGKGDGKVYFEFCGFQSLANELCVNLHLDSWSVALASLEFCKGLLFWLTGYYFD